MGSDPTDIAGAGEFHARGRAQYHGETAAERVGWEMVLSLSAGGHTRDGVCRDPGIHHKEAEHGCAVHCDATNSGPLRTDHAEGGGDGVPSVVVAEEHRFGDGKGTGGGGHIDGFRVRIEGRVGSIGRGRGGARGRRGGGKHI